MVLGVCVIPNALAADFAIDARTLSQALIQFSHQSGKAIVFSDRETRHLPAPVVTGEQSYQQALDTLLANSHLYWEQVEGDIIAIGKSDCVTAASGDCTSLQDVALQHPAYRPGLEETYVYGRHLTGSRVHRNPLLSAMPVERISGAAIESSGAQSLGELLRFVPSVAGNATSTAISNGGDGTATVTLRGLPASNTLVLLNGKRMANDGLAGDAFDLNSLSPTIVERIDILKHGASAIYGSDAIAGVVNIITKDTFSGGLLEGYTGQAGAGDLQTHSGTLQYGTSLPAGNIVINTSYYRQEPLFSRDRAVSASADSRLQGGSDARSSATPDARITLPGGETLIAQAGAYRNARDEDLYNYQQDTTAIVPLERTSTYAHVSYDLSDILTARVLLNHSSTRATAQLAPTPVFTAFEQTPLTIAADNKYNPFGVELVDVRRRVSELGPRQQHNSAKTHRASITLEGSHAVVQWDASYSWSYAVASQRLSHVIDADRLARALGSASECRGAAIDDCTPVNLTGADGSITAQQLDSIRTFTGKQGYSKLDEFSFHLESEWLELPHGPVDAALGISYRRESTRSTPVNGARVTIGGNNLAATAGRRHVAEMYGEALLPLWRNRPDSRSLDAEIALRYSHYSDFGTSVNPRLGMRMQLHPGLVLRVNATRSFRAPSLHQLYMGASESQAAIDDPCTDAARFQQLPGCLQLADSTRHQFLTVTGGNPDLKPESASSYSLGLIWTDTYRPLSASLDFFEIQQKDVVNASAQFIVDQNASQGLFASAVERDERGNLTRVWANFLNTGDRQVRGIDFAASYSLHATPWGKFSFNLNTTYLDRFKAQLNAAANATDFAGTFVDDASEGLGGIPRLKSQIGMQWRNNRWRGHYEIYRVSAMSEKIPDSNLTRKINEWIVHDVQLSYTFDYAAGLRWAVGVDNLFDASAPFSASAFNDNIDGRTHELKGRYWYTRLTQRI